MTVKKEAKIAEKVATAPKLQGKLERLLQFRPTTQERDGIKQQFQENMEADGELFIIRLQEYDVLIGKAGDVQSYVDRNTETTSLYDRIEKDNTDLHFRIQSQEGNLHNLRAALKDSNKNIEYLRKTITNREEDVENIANKLQKTKDWKALSDIIAIWLVLGMLYVLLT